MDSLRVVSAGAARALVGRLTASAAYRVPPVAASFGPVGAVDAMVREDTGFDVVITSASGLAALDGLCEPGSSAEIGVVPTVIAVPAGSVVHTPASDGEVRNLLLAAGVIYCADLVKSTAGRYVARLLADLDVATEITTRTYPEGAAALRALAGSEPKPGLSGSAPSIRDGRPIAIAQLTEVRATPGVQALAATSLPGRLGLETPYLAAVGMRSARREVAHRFVDVLTGAATAGLRAKCGFTVAS